MLKVINFFILIWLSLYEGTNGIQAIDFVTRKILKDGGIYFNPNNDYELANQIERFIKDKKFRKKKSKRAFNISLRYNWKNNVEQFCNLVNKLSKWLYIS